MTKAIAEKIYPDHTFEKEVRAQGIRCEVFWEMPGPKNTDVAWIVCYCIGNHVALVETFKSGGWNVFTPNASGDIKETVKDAIDRCLAEPR